MVRSVEDEITRQWEEETGTVIGRENWIEEIGEDRRG